MVLGIFKVSNSKIIKEHIADWNVSDEKLSKALESHLSKVYNEKVDIVFSSLSDIARMNNEYRGVEGPTDVLSFSYEQHDVASEIYVCPEYISQSYSGEEAVEEVLRCIIHGILHVAGYNHDGYFDEGSKEEMFVKQEEIINNIRSDLGIK